MFAHSLFRRTLVPALLALGLASFVSAPQPAHAQTAQAAAKPVLATLHRFDGVQGANSQSTLTLGKDGNFYGVAAYGGLQNNGTVFRMTPAGQFTTLFRFNGKNGSHPFSQLVNGKDGALYGGTYEGGPYGAGTLFRIDQTGHLTTLRSFVSSAQMLYHPYVALTLAPDGSFYGVAGASTVFHLTPDGHVSVLPALNSQAGSDVTGPLVFGPDGALYGATYFGGTQNNGTVFRLTTGGHSTVLRAFNRAEIDGTGQRVLTFGPDGALYGTAASSTNQGNTSGCGSVFRLTLSGQFTTLHRFSPDGHGMNPQSGLTLGPDGLFYGTTGYGGFGENGPGYSGLGTVFSMTPSGQVTTLYKFHTAFDGSISFGGVLFGPDGALYGAALYGGPYASTNDPGYGTLYKLTLPQ